eukprot:2592050-Prymnesium_polylepis.5
MHTEKFDLERPASQTQKGTGDLERSLARYSVSYGARDEKARNIFCMKVEAAHLQESNRSGVVFTGGSFWKAHAGICSNSPGLMSVIANAAHEWRMSAKGTVTANVIVW